LAQVPLKYVRGSHQRDPQSTPAYVHMYRITHVAFFLVFVPGGTTLRLPSEPSSGHGFTTDQADPQYWLQEFHDNTAPCDDLNRQARCVEAVKTAMPKLKRHLGSDANASGCLFHTAVDSDIHGRAISMLAKSFLATQAGNSILRIYSDNPDNLKQKLNASFSSCESGMAKHWQSRIEVTVLNEGFNEAFEISSRKAISTKARRKEVRAKTDLLRFKFLKEYGGIYVDADILFLADLSPLCGTSFAYRWSSLDNFNTAVMGLPKGSPFAEELLARNGGQPSRYHPHQVPSELAGVTLIRLPSLLFDPSWLLSDGLDQIEPASNINLTLENFDTKPLPTLSFFAEPLRDPFENAFPASLTYHWHGGRLSSRSACQYHGQEDGEPVAVQMERALDKKFRCGQC